MKKLILKTAIFGTSLILLSFGENPKNESKNEVKQENQISVSATKMNILYVGLDNPLDIAIPNESSENISVSIDNGTVEKSLSANKTKIDLLSTENTADITITSEAATWAINSSATWAKLSVTSGIKGTFLVSVTANGYRSVGGFVIPSKAIK